MINFWQKFDICSQLKYYVSRKVCFGLVPIIEDLVSFHLLLRIEMQDYKVFDPPLCIVQMVQNNPWMRKFQDRERMGNLRKVKDVFT